MDAKQLNGKAMKPGEMSLTDLGIMNIIMGAEPGGITENDVLTRMESSGEPQEQTKRHLSEFQRDGLVRLEPGPPIRYRATDKGRAIWAGKGDGG